MKIDPSFYIREDVTKIARELVGKVLFTCSADGVAAGRITETEAYSYREKACHAYNNRRTKRTETLFRKGGTSYVYLCYGIHHLFNIVTNRVDVAEAVLIRALEPVDNIALMRQRRGIYKDVALTTGPGKLSQAMGISMAHNEQFVTGSTIWLEDDGTKVLDHEVVAVTRVGVDYAQEDASLPWRFYLSKSQYISRR